MPVLYKTTIVIWSEFNPSRWSLLTLAQEAEDGQSYCSKQETVRVPIPPNDPDWDGTEFFGVDEEDEAE